VGPRISHRLLATVTGMPLAQLQSRLWSLEILDFLVEPRSITDPEHEFSHDLIRESPMIRSCGRNERNCIVGY